MKVKCTILFYATFIGYKTCRVATSMTTVPVSDSVVDVEL